jgi:hemerythrin-like domain-containing protein
MLRAELAALNAQHHPTEDMLLASVVEPMIQDVVKSCVLLKNEWEKLRRDCESLKRECENLKER